MVVSVGSGGGVVGGRNVRWGGREGGRELDVREVRAPTKRDAFKFFIRESDLWVGGVVVRKRWEEEKMMGGGTGREAGGIMRPQFWNMEGKERGAKQGGGGGRVGEGEEGV